MQNPKIIIKPLVITLWVLLIPFLGNIFFDGWNWNCASFVILGAILFSALLGYELADKKFKTGMVYGFLFWELFATGVIATLKYINPNDDIAGIVILSFLVFGIFFTIIGYLINKYFRRN